MHLLPLARPGLAAVAVLTMVTSWNNFFLPLVVLNTERRWTLPRGVLQFQGQYGTDGGRVLACVSLALTPAVVFSLFAERQIIAGLTAGAVKGVRRWRTVRCIRRVRSSPRTTSSRRRG